MRIHSQGAAFMVRIFMRASLIVFLCTIPVATFGQVANRAVLTLVDEAGFNEVDIGLDVSGIGSSNDTSDLSGTIEVQLNISPATVTSNEMTILSADVSGTDVTLDASLPFGLASYSFESKDLGFTAFTPEAPGIVDPLTGEFDASQHELTVNRGTLKGEASTLLTGDLDVPDFDFATDNFIGNGEGTGTVSISSGRIEGRKLYFNVTLEFPAVIEQAIEDLPVDADVKIEGTLKATGETFIEYPDYADWASEVGVGASSQFEFDLSPNTPNEILFSLGFDETNFPEQLFDFTSAGATLKNGQDIALGDVEIQWSNDLITWTRVPLASMTSGSSVISFGDPLTEATVVGPNGTRKYLRVASNPEG
jgi:hypothetical protein